MRRNTKLKFTARPDRPPLSSSEARYWKSILSKVCKVGFEYEYNLKEPIGRCTGNSFACPCSHPNKEKTKCYNKCKLYDTCKLRKKYDCPGVFCIEFESPCPDCPDVVHNCEDCELFMDPNKTPDKIRDRLKSTLFPTEDIASVGQTGVLSVIKDGSLKGDGGVEVTTVGRRVNFDSFYKQSKIIIDECAKLSAYTNERASIHMHLVAGYYDLVMNQPGGEIKAKYTKRGRGGNNGSINELEKDVPEIIVANFHQLLRRYQNAITWITSSGDNEEALTRWCKFRQSISKYSSLRTSMRFVCDEIRRGIDSDGKYAFVNYYNCKFNSSTSNFKRFHVEARYCDGMMSPAAVAALGVMLHALLLKAVVFSSYGIVHSGDKEYMMKANKIQDSLLNNNGSYGGPRTSATAGFGPYKETVRKQAEELVTLLKPELKPHGKAMDILYKLADMPCSMRRCRGDRWEKIEKDLSGDDSDETGPVRSVLQAIDTFYIDDCIDRKEWEQALSESSEVEISPDSIKRATEVLIKNRTIHWDNQSGTFVRC